MITLQELCEYLNGLLELSNFSDYCPNGLQVEGERSVVKIATAVSASLNTIEQAVSLNVQGLLVHHGIFWNRDPYPIMGTKREKLLKLLQHNISLLAYHLPLDAHQQFGNNWKAARDMGWKDLEPFGIVDGNTIGVKGKVKKQTRDRFKKTLEEFYGHEAHCALGGREEIETVSLISGGAYRYCQEAALKGIDCFITGNFDEPAWHTAFEEKINFFAMGHSATERIGPQSLREHLKEKFSIEVTFIEDHNPF